MSSPQPANLPIAVQLLLDMLAMYDCLLLVSLAALLVACDGNSNDDGTSNSGGVGGAGGTGLIDAASGGAAGTAGSGGTGAGGSDGGGGCEPVPQLLAPGELLTQQTASGGGTCSGTTVVAFLAKIHAAHPELADIKAIYSPDLSYDGSFVYPYRTPVGAFAFALKRGSGDCPSGCTENEYWYFESDANCGASDAGHFKPTWSQSCLAVDGQARWGRPPEPDPATICGAELTPENISGKKQLWACGMRLPCTGAKLASEPIASFVSVTIAQDGSDPKTGNVTFSGTGYAGIDDRPLPATFLRRRFAVSFHEDNLPSACPHSLDVTAGFDFEGFGMMALTVDELTTPDCSVALDYCKGGVQAKLFAAQP